jgi:hypothetical protein
METRGSLAAPCRGQPLQSSGPVFLFFFFSGKNP